MPVYQYKNTDIDQVTVRRTEKGAARAYLHAGENADPTRLAAIKANFEAQGWICIPTEEDGKPALEVRGFKKDENLLRALSQGGFVQGRAEGRDLPEDKISLKDKWKKRTLEAAGYVYFAGDAAFTYYGYSGARWQNMAAGLFYFLGSLSLAVFGKAEHAEMEIRDASKDLQKFLQSRGMEVADGAAIQQSIRTENTSRTQKALNFCRKYPAEIMNSMFALAGLFIMSAAPHDWKEAREIDDIANKAAKLEGFQEGAEVLRAQAKNTRRSGALDIGLGLMTLLSGLLSIFVKERAPDPNAEPKKGAASVWAKVQEKPLKIAGFGYLISTLCHAASTTLSYRTAGELNEYAGTALQKIDGMIPEKLSQQDHKMQAAFFEDKPGLGEFREALVQGQTSFQKLKKSIPFRGIFVASNLGSELLMAASSKGHGVGVKSDPNVNHSLLASAADAIAASTTLKDRARNIAETAAFLAVPHYVGGNANKIEEELTRRIASWEKNPWARTTVTHRHAQNFDTEISLAQPGKSWEQRVSVPSTAVAQSPTL